MGMPRGSIGGRTLISKALLRLGFVWYFLFGGVRWSGGGQLVGGTRESVSIVFNDIWGSLGKFACGERWREGDTSGATVEARGHAAEIEIL